MKARENYRITAVRLVEFHNIGTTVIDIPEGGHLFLLGDNGSGKTTILDAVHLVLSGGDGVEFNSAARVAGSKDSGGRTIQGIVLRYNAVTGRTARETGITYAAVELRSDAGRILSLVVGLSAEGLDIRYQSWAGIAPVYVRELPLTIEEGGRLRAATQEEFKRAMTVAVQGGKYFVHMRDYRETVAARLFGGIDKYEDARQLLKIGKAYREIASKAVNYDDLFRQLLEEPRGETFAPLLQGLRELDESKGRLAQIDERAGYLGELQKRVAAVGQARTRILVIAWAEATEARDAAVRDIKAFRKEADGYEDEMKSLVSLVSATRAEAERARERLDELRKKDGTGLLGREKEVVARLAESKRRAAGEAERLAAEEAEVQASVKARRDASARCAAVLKRENESVLKAGQAADFPCGELADGLLGADPASARAVCEPLFQSARSLLSDLHDKRLGIAHEARSLAAEAQKNAAAAEDECARLRARKENLPAIEGYAEAKAALNEKMLAARSVYELLEPMPGCDGRHLALLERLAGEEFLATFIADEREADTVRKILWREGGSFAVAVREDCSGDVPQLTPWLGTYISFEESDPAAVRLLASHLAARNAPRDGEFLSAKTWNFRDREAPFAEGRARLIGRKAREAELARLRRAAEERLAAAVRERKAKEKAAQLAEASVQALREFARVAESARAAIQEASAVLEKAGEREERAVYRRDRTREIADEKAREANEIEIELEDIRLKMRAEGIDESLEKRIASAEKNLRKKEEDVREHDRRIGAVGDRIKSIELRLQERAADESAAVEKADAAAAAFSGSLLEGESVEAGAARLYPQALGQTDYASLREECCGDERVAENDIRRMIRDNKGQSFIFSYDSLANRLADRYGKDIGEVAADETRKLNELREAINQKSCEIFERIFIGEVMRRLWQDHTQIKSLEARIKSKLAGRPFGSNRYSFELKPVPAYERFVELVRKGGSLYDAGDGKDELRAYLDEHRNEITEADFGQIPDIFDYRKWFSFQLKVISENDRSRVIDSRVKSIGSGGEQAVPNYLLILTVAEFLYHGCESEPPKLAPLLFDEAFYGIDAARRDQLLSFADDLGLQLFVSSPDQDGVKREIRHSVSLIVIKDQNLDVHLSPIVWTNDSVQTSLFESEEERGKGGLKVLGETE